jgi:hypothetical protein
MKRKAFRQFLRENRTDIDSAIKAAVTRYDSPGLNRQVTLNDEERRLWILNDEGLYNWARSEGVQI